MSARREAILNKLEEINSQLPNRIKEAEAIQGKLAKELAVMDKTDARENAPYQAKLEEVAQANSLLKRLNIRNDAWNSFNSYATTTSSVQIGSGVELQDETNGYDYYFVIVQKELADAENGALSMTTPVGKAITGRTKGEVVQVDTPSGAITYKIQEVE